MVFKSKKRLFQIIEVGYDLDFVSKAYDWLNVLSIIVNVLVSVLYTYDDVKTQFGSILVVAEIITVFFFAIDYFLRLWTADVLYSELPKGKALCKYMFSFMGIVDLLSFLPYFLPIFFPVGAVAFRMIRIVRIFRLFRINA